MPNADLDARLMPYQALIDGRAAVIPPPLDSIAAGRATFEALLHDHQHDASLHVGLANACALQFDSTLADGVVDADALSLAVAHARTACRLRPDDGEAWATLGFVLERAADRDNALAALHRSVTLEPNNWRHQLRIASATWGEDRLSGTRRALALSPNLPVAHRLAATVFVARQALGIAEREVDAGLALMTGTAGSTVPAAGLHLLKGLLCLARGDHARALESFDRELTFAAGRFLHAREMAADAWYAIGACHLRHGDAGAARIAFDEAIGRVPSHAMARTGVAMLAPDSEARPPSGVGSLEQSIAWAARLVTAGDLSGAAQRVAAALSTTAGPAGWLIPIEPLLNIDPAGREWTTVLAILSIRAR